MTRLIHKQDSGLQEP